MFFPQHATALDECFSDARLSIHHSLDHIKTTAYVERTVLIGEGQLLLWRETVTTAFRLILYIASCGLVDKPFTHVTLDCTRMLGQFSRSEWSGLSQRLIKSEFFPDVRKPHAQCRTQIGHHFAHE